MKALLKHTLALVLALGLFASCCEKEVYLFSGHREPALDGLHFLYSYDGYHWDSLPGSWLQPEVGNKHAEYYNVLTQSMEPARFSPQSMMRDPSLCQGPDGRFHLVWTIAWSGERGFGYASSDDLIHWSEQRVIPVMQDSLTNNVWAPEVFYDPETEEFLIAWSSSIMPQAYTEADRLGQNNAHRQYYTTTKDFESFAPAKPFYDPGFNSIDAFVLRRAPQDYVVIIKDNRKPGYSDLFCAFAPAAAGPYTRPSVKFAPVYSEGACAIQVGQDWLIYFDVYREARFGAVRTRDFQTFEPIDDEIYLPEGHKHGTIIKVKESVLKKMQAHASAQGK